MHCTISRGRGVRGRLSRRDVASRRILDHSVTAAAGTGAGQGPITVIDHVSPLGESPSPLALLVALLAGAYHIGPMDGAAIVARRLTKRFDDVLAVDEASFEAVLFTAGLPDPDLLIRTSDEFRLSNFMLWQVAYTEFHIASVLWPDFSREDLFRAVLDFQERDRRFGRVTVG